MFQKLTPLIILLLFAAGVYFMKKGMDSAAYMAQPKKVSKTTTQP